MSRRNCWEFMGCGRQPGGAKVIELGTCPVAKEARLDGVHNGLNGGRSCWIVTESLSKGEKRGTFGSKFKKCEICAFYRTVRKEEFPKFILSVVLKKRLEG